MKNLFITSLLFLTIQSYAQVIADPATNTLQITNLVNDPLSSSSIPNGTTINLKIPILNLNTSNALPAGTCKIKIGLGSKLIMDPAFDLAGIMAGNYFLWTSETSGGQVQVTGSLISQLPANFSSTANLRVMGSLAGSSTITTNFLVTNHNSQVTLSDENPSNNNAFLAYSIITPVPVTFTKISATNKLCGIDVNFSTEKEIQVLKYEIEVSIDGIHYSKKGELPAANSPNYSYHFSLNDSTTANSLYIRIKSVDRDGKFQYSRSAAVSGKCDGAFEISIYPNPVAKNKEVQINTKAGIFNGDYSILVYNIQGGLVARDVISLTNTRQFSYSIRNLVAGKYFIRLLAKDIVQSGILQLEIF